MAQFLGFGNGSDGDVNLAAGTEVPIDSSCAGTAGTRTLTVGSGLAFAAGQIVMIHKSRGNGTTTCGTYELACVESYVGTTLTLVTNLANTYNDSGDDASQVRVLKQYRSVVVSGAFLAKPWDGDTGGILAFMCSGEVTFTAGGSLNGSGRGFRGNNTVSSSSDNANMQGEGSAGAGALSHSANGNGGGGGEYENNGQTWATGGGAGHAASGTAGTAHPGGQAATAGDGGGTAGVADLTTMVFGGASGCGSDANGATGGAIIFIIAKKFTLTNGTIVSGGDNGTVGNATGGSGGAGGSVLIKAGDFVIGSGLITVPAGTGGSANHTAGSNGAVGRVAVEGCTGSGDSTPAANQTIGGREWCVAGGFIY